MNEKHLHKQICTYLKTQYKDVIFLSDMSGLRTSIGIAVQMKALRSSRAIPDLIILKPNKEFCGLIIEIKCKASDIYLKDGVSLKNNAHVKEQAEMLRRLKELGYYACFGIGFDNCKTIIDNYMKL